MADQQASPEEMEPTPEEGGIDWEKRYNDLRPQWDRAQNQINQLNDPEYRQQLFTELAEEHGYTFADDAEYLDPTEQLRAELRQEFQQELKQRDEALQYQEAVSHAQKFANDKLDELGVKNAKAREWIETRSTAMPALQDEHGYIVPDVEAAYSEYTALLNEEKKTWGERKSGAVGASEGHADTGVPSWRNEQDPDKRREMRNQWAMEQVQLRTQ